ncbi:OmpA family protein [Pararhodobacter sp. SW119]|uniref:OmpA family protein n=1 Tax=Pararhodobacter sp. SW119 TaxID=2780075 RepID=UPI001AE0BA69|nr:OmpA family protein [Pararhodobacter sp. SW119]
MPRLIPYLPWAVFAVAAFVAVLAAALLAGTLERQTRADLETAFAEARMDWVEVATDGLRVHLSGTAPDERARLTALRLAGGVVHSARLRDTIEAQGAAGVVSPVFRIEALRNHDRISVIGLVPAVQGAGAIVERMAAIEDEIAVADMLQSADHPVPPGWEQAVDYALGVLTALPVAQVSVTAGRIEVQALVASDAARQQLESELRAAAPRGQVVILDLEAPRPILSPYTFRFVLDEDGTRLEACAADNDDDRDRILSAVRRAGANERLTCTIGMGMPAPRWAQAVELGVETLAGLGAGTLGFSDTDVALRVPATVAQAEFDRAVGRLETRLPEAFTLTAERREPDPDSVAEDDTLPELRATLDTEGRVLIAGRLPDERIRGAVTAFANARFGSEAVTLEARLDPELPSGWSVRALTALEALAELNSGSVLMRADRVDLTGISGNPEASDRVTRILSDGLGADARLAVRVRYDEELDPVAQAPTPERCESRVQAVLAARKITFAPGSAQLDSDSRAVLDEIAEILRECGELPLEVAGHTDSQGRAETNQRLSQERAEAVINGLLERRVLVAGMVAQGYGQDNPIADNATAAGREANRRIEISLIRPEPEPAARDAELEAQLVFEVQTPDADDTRPRARPAPN